MDYQEPEYYLFPPKEQYYILKKRIKAFIWGATIFSFVGFVVGQWWRMNQVEPEREAQMLKLQKKVDYFKENWSPNKEVETKAIKGKKK